MARGDHEAGSVGFSDGIDGKPCGPETHSLVDRHREIYEVAWRRGHLERLALDKQHPEGKTSIYGHRRTLVWEEGTVDVPLQWVPKQLADEQIDLEGPDYQRGHVWTEEQQVAFMGALIDGDPIGLIVTNRAPDVSPLEPAELVDGKQRLTAIMRWLRDEIPARLWDGRLIRYSDLTACSQGVLGRYHIKFARSVKSRVDILAVYLRLNGGGTPHTQAELDRVRELWRRAAAEAEASGAPVRSP